LQSLSQAGKRSNRLPVDARNDIARPQPCIKRWRSWKYALHDHLVLISLIQHNTRLEQRINRGNVLRHG